MASENTGLSAEENAGIRAAIDIAGDEINGVVSRISRQYEPMISRGSGPEAAQAAQNNLRHVANKLIERLKGFGAAVTATTNVVSEQDSGTQSVRASAGGDPSPWSSRV